MATTDFRLALNIRYASRTSPTFIKNKGSSLAAKNGLRYERKVGRELERQRAEGHFISVEHNPWFQFEDIYGASQCSPDFLIHSENELTIVEVKLTWVDVAIQKLNDLYNPVISFALSRPVFPLIICRNLTNEAPPAKQSLSEALKSPYRLLHWPEIGHMLW